MSVLTECSNLWNYQSITTCSEFMSNIILYYIRSTLKEIAGRIKLRKKDFYLKSCFSGMVGVFPQATLILKWQQETRERY